MDDNNTPTIGLDLNPDMMTTQTSIPTVVPPITTSQPSPNVIDITPGSSASTSTVQPTSQHIDIAPLPDHKVIDITPEGPAPESVVSSDAAPLNPPLTESSLSSSVDTPATSHLVDILPQNEPQSPSPTDVGISSPISDILHEVTPTAAALNTTSTPVQVPATDTLPPLASQTADQTTVLATPVSQTPSTPSTPIEIQQSPLPGPSTQVEVSTPAVQTDAAVQNQSDIAATPEAQMPQPAAQTEAVSTQSPLYEDPDAVKLP